MRSAKVGGSSSVVMVMSRCQCPVLVARLAEDVCPIMLCLRDVYALPFFLLFCAAAFGKLQK